MKYYMPARVYAEENCIANHAEEICSLGTHAYLITGRSSAEKNGSLDDVKAILENAGIPYEHFNEIEENPSVDTIMKAVYIGLDEHVDFVIGIGGGSPMDAAKAVAMMVCQKEKRASYLYEKGSDEALPLVLIPTTCGTGSEVTGVSVLTRHDLGTKLSMFHSVFADLALLDGKYLTSLPHSVLADTTMDALAHCMESYINADATVYSRMCADAGLKQWGKSKDVIQGKREAQPADYLNMLHASAMAGMAIAQTGTSLPHGLSYTVTYQTHMPHGKACGYFLPGYLREASAKDAAHVLKKAGFASLDKLEKYYQKTSRPEEPPVKVLEAGIQEILQSPGRLAKVPFAVDEAMLRRMARL